MVGRYRALGIDQQLDYDKFYLYSIITHSTAIEGSTITELENQIMFDNGIALKGKSLIEQNMNLDLKAAYERALIKPVCGLGNRREAHSKPAYSFQKSLLVLSL